MRIIVTLCLATLLFLTACSSQQDVIRRSRVYTVVTKEKETVTGLLFSEDDLEIRLVVGDALRVFKKDDLRSVSNQPAIADTVSTATLKSNEILLREIKEKQDSIDSKVNFLYFVTLLGISVSIVVGVLAAVAK